MNKHIHSIIAVTCMVVFPPHSAFNGNQSTLENGVDASHYDFTLSLPDTGATITGNAQITLRRLRDVQSVAVDLVDLRVDSVLVNGIRSDFERNQSSLTIPLPRRSSPTCDTLLLQIAYEGTVHEGLNIHPDDAGRWSAFGDNWPERARFWIPCLDRPDDKATVTWRIIAPAERLVVANGAFVEKTSVSSTSMTHRAMTIWNESQPISTYLMVIAVGTLVRYDLPSRRQVVEKTQQSVQQSIYVQPELLDNLPGPFQYANDIVSFYSDVIAPFPYEKLAHVQSSTRYGGMENASAIFYANEGFASRSMGPEVIAHETAHQWFGDAVTEKDWSHLWLSEGFATYFQELWTLHEFGDSAFKAEMNRTRNEVIHARVVRERPVIDSLQSNLMRLLDVNSYQKGAWFLHMLRSMLGDSIFYPAIRSYYTKHKNSSALTDDLEREFEIQSNKGLRWFFEQWLRRPGYATIASVWSYNEHSKQIQLTIEQRGAFPPYRFPLTVDLISSEGARIRERLPVEAISRTVIKITSPFVEKPKEILLDPDTELLAQIVPF